jgi:hypothetical protein
MSALRDRLLGKNKPRPSSEKALFALDRKKSIESPLFSLRREVKNHVALYLDKIASDIRTALYKKVTSEEFYTPLVRLVASKFRQPENGKDGETPTDEQLTALIQKVMPKVRDGKDAPELSVIVSAVMLRIAQPRDGKDADVDAVIQAVIKKIVDDRKLTVNDISGLREEIASYRNQLALGGMRGGGDTVVAGSGVTFSTDANGNKVINAGGGLSVLAATGTINDTNTAFTFASSPTFVVVNGAFYRDGSGCTIAGVNVTLDNPIGTGGSIFGLG